MQKASARFPDEGRSALHLLHRAKIQAIVLGTARRTLAGKTHETTRVVRNKAPQ
jgi:hypothetical protein